MARITCRCGRALSNSNHPEVEYQVFNDAEWHRLMASKINDPLVDIEWPELSFWKCSRCGRLHLFNGDSDMPIAVYVIEPISPGESGLDSQGQG